MKRPLRVLVTRPVQQAGEFIEELRAASFEPVQLPVIETGQVADTSQLDEALRNLSSYDWIVLTSANGVHAVWARFEVLGLPGIPASVRVAAIGPKTAAALEKRGAHPNFVPDEYIAEAILPGLGDLKGRRVLLARADLARPALADAIRAAGGAADEITAYRTLPARPDPQAMEALRKGVDVITLTSSSTVNNFVSLVRQAGLDPMNLPGRPVFACIGPITAQTAREEGLPVDIVASEYTAQGLVEAIKNFQQQA